MNRTSTTARMLAFVFAATLLAISATAGTIYVDAARPDDTGDGLTPATAKQTIAAGIPLLVSGDTLSIATGTYTEATVTFNGAAGQNFNNKDNITISGTPDNPATPGVDERPLVKNGFYFLNDTNTGLTIENISFDGRIAAQPYLLYLANNGNGRTNLTIRYCKFDGRDVTTPALVNGVYCNRTNGTLRFENNEVTRLTGNVAFSPTGAGSAVSPYIPTYAYVQNNWLHNTTGAVDTRGGNTIDSFNPAALPMPNPIMYFVSNVYEQMPPSPAPSGGAFKIFHAREGYFLNNYIVATSVTGNNYAQDQTLVPTADPVPHGAGLLYLNVGKLVVAGNTFQDCLQAIGHDPHPSSLGPNNNTPPLDFQIFNNTFSNNTVAIYFPSTTSPGENYVWAATPAPPHKVYGPDSTTSTLEIYGNNFSNNDTGIFSQSPSDDLVIDAQDNWWGTPAGPGPGDIVLEFPGPSIDTSNPSSGVGLPDSDGDGLLDNDEILGNNPQGDTSDPNLKDTDGDGFEDGIEVAAGTDPDDALDFPASQPPAGQDSDGDGYTDRYEIGQNTDPNDPGDKPALGDATGDGQVDNVDAIVIVAIVVQVTGFDINRFNFAQMDINRDGVITNVDAIQLLNFFLGNIAAIPTN